MNPKTLLQLAILLVCMCALSTTTTAQLSVVAEPNTLWRASTDGNTYISVCWENLEGYETETHDVSQDSARQKLPAAK